MLNSSEVLNCKHGGMAPYLFEQYICTIFLADIEVACYGYEGINAVKDALRVGLSCSTETMPIKMNVMAPPRYVMTTTTLERTEGLSVLNQAMAAIKERIEEKRCVFNIQIELNALIISGSGQEHLLNVVTDMDEIAGPSAGKAKAGERRGGWRR
eukprot:XP_014061522.1 PREDICTED: eukaryotic translation initiation factor 2 subunit 1-like [Salmo salar]